MNEDLSGFDVAFAVLFTAAVVALTYWFLTIVDHRFADAVIAHFAALARGNR